MFRLSKQGNKGSTDGSWTSWFSVTHYCRPMGRWSYTGS